MNEISFLHDQLRRSYQGPAWHGPSILEILEGVNAETADRKSGGAHSIAELVRHIAAWEAVAIQALRGAEYPSLPPDEDWPSSHGSWEADQAHLEKTHRQLERTVLAFPEAHWHETINGNRDYTYAFLLHGVVQHNLYHAGQIAILKRIG